jgi:uncharacterized protein with HEPN domain
MRSDSERLLDIAESIDNIKKYLPRGHDAFYQDELFQSWVVRNLQIAGEAANRISIETRSKFTFVPWEKMIGMRHILVHGYFEIDLDVVWSVLENDLSELDAGIQRAINDFLHSER